MNDPLMKLIKTHFNLITELYTNRDTNYWLNIDWLTDTLTEWLTDKTREKKYTKTHSKQKYQNYWVIDWILNWKTHYTWLIAVCPKKPLIVRFPKPRNYLKITEWLLIFPAKENNSF